jgi:gliding motility-associated-like protein
MKMKISYCLCVTLCLATLIVGEAWSQCKSLGAGGQRITTIPQCIPYNYVVRAQFTNATPGDTEYYVDWGDGSFPPPGEHVVQSAGSFFVNPTTGAFEYFEDIKHRYKTSVPECAYTVTLQAINPCTPVGSTKLIFDAEVWDKDKPQISLSYIRICDSFNGTFVFSDISRFNCNPNPILSRTNLPARWVEFDYGVTPPAWAPPAAPIPPSKIKINGSSVTFPYKNPALGGKPKYPVSGPYTASLPITITQGAPIGSTFWMKMSNWNTCNPYDAVLSDGALNPVNPAGDSLPVITHAPVFVVPSPNPNFDVHGQSFTGPLQRQFCIGENIYAMDLTPLIPPPAPGYNGSIFAYQWIIYDGPTDSSPILNRYPVQNDGTAFAMGLTKQQFSFPRSGLKLIRLRVKDINALGDCTVAYDDIIEVIEPVVAEMETTDNDGNVLDPSQLHKFCDNNPRTFTFEDISTIPAPPPGTVGAVPLWRWEMDKKIGGIPTTVASYPNVPPGNPGDFSATQLPYFQDPATGLNQITLTEGEYTIRLILKDQITTCESRNEIKITMVNQPVIDFTAVTVCNGVKTHFVPSATLTTSFPVSMVRYAWDFDYDGVTFVEDKAFFANDPVDKLFPVGTHTVAYRVSTNSGCDPVMIVKDIKVAPLPQPSFTYPSGLLCGTTSVDFVNTTPALPAGSSINEFIWEVDEQNGLGYHVENDQVNPPFPYPPATLQFENTTSLIRYFKVRLTAVSDDNCSVVSADQIITVYPGGAVVGINSNYNPFDPNCAPLNSVFFQASSNTQALHPINYLWELTDKNGNIIDQRDGPTQSLYTPTPGALDNYSGTTYEDYDVSLTVMLLTGCQYQTSMKVRVNPEPIGDFSSNISLLTCGEIGFTLDAVYKGYTDYQWTIKLNGVSQPVANNGLSTLMIQYPRMIGADQQVEISLQVVNFATCKSPVVTQNLVVPQQKSIDPNFSVSPGTPPEFPDAGYDFTHLNFDPDWTYTWSFGDGSPAVTLQDLSVHHDYTKPGTFWAKLTAAQGTCVFKDSIEATVLAHRPIVDFDYDPATGCAPLLVNFTNKSQYVDPSSFEWDFGVGEAPSYAINPSHLFEKPGIYTVKLSAKDAADGLIAVNQKNFIIEVKEKPLAYFSAKPIVVYIPGKVYLINQSLGATDYHWDFGDETTSTEFQPTHEYTKEGIFGISLIAYASNTTCADTFKLATGIQALYGGDIYLPNAFVPSALGPGNGRADQNSLFLPLTRGLRDYNLQIFNRWGQLVFETADTSHGWDGYYNGQPCPPDVYVYKLTTRQENGQTVTRVGDINLIR